MNDEAEILLNLRAEIIRNGAGKLVHLAVYGFPAEWSDAQILEDCRRAVAEGTASEIDHSIIESGGGSFGPTNTGGPDCRLYVDDF